MESFKNKPDIIKKAITEDNTEALRAAGRKGAEVTNAKKAKTKEIDEMYRMRIAELKNREDEEMRRDANEHILTPDGEEPDFADEK